MSKQTAITRIAKKWDRVVREGEVKKSACIAEMRNEIIAHAEITGKTGKELGEERKRVIAWAKAQVAGDKYTIQNMSQNFWTAVTQEVNAHFLKNETFTLKVKDKKTGEENIVRVKGAELQGERSKLRDVSAQMTQRLGLSDARANNSGGGKQDAPTEIETDADKVQKRADAVVATIDNALVDDPIVVKAMFTLLWKRAPQMRMAANKHGFVFDIKQATLAQSAEKPEAKPEAKPKAKPKAKPTQAAATS